MSDEMLTHDNVIAVSFPQEASAYEAFSRLKELDSQGSVGVRGAAVVIREEDGRITIKDQFGEDNFEDTAGGGLIGLLVGVLGGPLGVVIGGTVGLLVGSLFDEDDYEERHDDQDRDERAHGGAPLVSGTRTRMPSSSRSCKDFSVALAPAASGSKFTTMRPEWRFIVWTCCVVSAVPQLATTSRTPAE